MRETPGNIVTALSPRFNRGYRASSPGDTRSIARRFTERFAVAPFRSRNPSERVSTSSPGPTRYPLDRRLIVELLAGIYLATKPDALSFIIVRTTGSNHSRSRIVE